jgi:hypothetical protein
MCLLEFGIKFGSLLRSQEHEINARLNQRRRGGFSLASGWKGVMQTTNYWLPAVAVVSLS